MSTNVVQMSSLRGHPEYCQGVEDGYMGHPMADGSTAIYRAGWDEGRGCQRRFAEDLTPEGIQLVIPGTERKTAPKQKQLDLF